MKLFVTGATGALGGPLVPALLAGDHEVRAVARDEAKAARLRAAGAEPVIVDVFDADAVRDSVAGSDAILHLATSVPPAAKMASQRAWRTNNRLRTEATANLLAAARDHGVGRFVKESISFLYPDRGDEWIDESVPLGELPKPFEPTLEGERLVEAFRAEGGAGTVLRFGLFYGPDNRMVDEALRVAKVHLATLAGAPDSYVSSIHMEDAASAVVAALTAAPDTYNVVDDEPLTRRAYTDAFAAAFELPHLRMVPSGPLRAVGGAAAKVLTASQRVSNKRFRDAAGWHPIYPSAREGWAAIGVARGHAHQTQEHR
jgi:nucleoside-diphosphate-sugar epimerase